MNQNIYSTIQNKVKELEEEMKKHTARLNEMTNEGSLLRNHIMQINGALQAYKESLRLLTPVNDSNEIQATVLELEPVD